MCALIVRSLNAFRNVLLAACPWPEEFVHCETALLEKHTSVIKLWRCESKSFTSVVHLHLSTSACPLSFSVSPSLSLLSNNNPCVRVYFWISKAISPSGSHCLMFSLSLHSRVFIDFAHSLRLRVHSVLFLKKQVFTTEEEEERDRTSVSSAPAQALQRNSSPNLFSPCFVLCAPLLCTPSSLYSVYSFTLSFSP